MIKIILPTILVAILIIGGAWYYRSSSKPSPTSLVTNLTSNSASEQERISSLENKVEVLARQIAQSNPESSSSPKPVSSTSTSADQKIKSLETTVAALQTQINQLKVSSVTSSTSPFSSSTSKSPVYIPLGWVGAASTTDWTTIANQELIFDPADYPGYKNVQFEVNLRVFQGNGTAYARLLNSSDGTGVTNSEISTSSQDYTWVSTTTLTLPSAKKTFKMQLRSSTGYEAGVQNARLKVNF